MFEIDDTANMLWVEYNSRPKVAVNAEQYSGGTPSTNSGRPSGDSAVPSDSWGPPAGGGEGYPLDEIVKRRDELRSDD